MSQTTVRARYQIIAKVASGGMGEVFRARDSVLGRDVAIKVLHRNLAGDQGFIERFRREARAAALLSHPNIVGVHDWGATTTGTYFMVMEFVRGRNVRDILTHHGRLEPAQTVEILIQALAALDHAHRHGIVHRDVKPENILVTPEGQVKVADFGLARAYAESRVSQAPGTVTGTVQYLAPEQVKGDPADPRTDLYATGVVAYELLTGTVPFHGETSVAIAYQHLSDRVPAPSKAVHDVPPELDRIVLQATEKERDDRPATAADLRLDLIGIAGRMPDATPLPELVKSLPAETTTEEDRAFTVTIPQHVSGRDRRRRRWRRFLTGLMILLLLAAGAWAAWTYVIPHYARVPNVVGLSGDDARARIEAAGLSAQFGAPVSSTTVPEGQVVREQPASGSRVRRDSDVTLQISAGLPLRLVPSVTGDKEARAVQAIRAAGLKVTVEHAFSDEVKKGRIVDQNPSGGQRIQYGSPVTITVSDGPKPIQIPDLTGRSSAEASSILTADGFAVEFRREYSDQVPVDDVIRQQPSGGEGKAGDTVTIWVSLGPRQFPMPSVIGMDGTSARSKLEGLGLHVNLTQIPGSSGATVVGQIPDPGATVQQGQQVSIYVA